MDICNIVYLSNIIHVSYMGIKNNTGFNNIYIYIYIYIHSYVFSFRPTEVECRVRSFVPNISYKDSTAIPINKTDTSPRGKENMNFRKKEKEILDAVLGSSRYDSRIRPAGHSNDTSK